MGLRITNIHKICAGDEQLYTIILGDCVKSRIDTGGCIKNINKHISDLQPDARALFLNRLITVFSQEQADAALEKNRVHLKEKFYDIPGAPRMEDFGIAQTVTTITQVAQTSSAFPFVLKARHAKDQEWQAAACSLSESYKTASGIPIDAPLPITLDHYKVKKTERMLLQISVLAEYKIDSVELAELAMLMNLPVCSAMDELKKVLGLFDLADQDHIITAHFLACSELDDTKLSNHYKDLQNICNKIKILCDSSANKLLSSDLVKKCENFLKEAFLNPAYRLLCIDEENPCVKFLHKIAIALFAGPNIAPGYLSFTKGIPAQGMLHQQIQALQSTLTKPAERDANVYSSEFMRIGSIGREHCISQESKIEILRLIGPGQILHDAPPNPILLLVLQSLENEICRAMNGGAPASLMGMVMVNMQDPTKPTETQSSTQLMKLGACYPLSLRIATISAHCPFSDNNLTDKTLDNCIEALTDDANFSFTQKTPRKYIFSPSEKDFFQRRIPELVRQANGITQNPTAFYELLKLALWTVFEVRALQSLQKQLPQAATAKILALCACHSGVDRGGSSHAERITALAKDVASQESAPHLWFARAAATWQRTPHHTDRAKAFSQEIPLPTARKFLQDVVAQSSDGTVRDLAFQIESMHI